MAALTADRDTKKQAENVLPELLSVPVAASTLIYTGALVCANSSGLAVPGSTATTLTALGRCEARADNSSGSASAINVLVRQGVFKFDNSTSTDAIVQATIGKDCYVVDDNTVAKTDGTGSRSRAGKVIQVDSDGVWVQIGIGL